MVWDIVGAVLGTLVFGILILSTWFKVRGIEDELGSFSHSIERLNGLPDELQAVLSMVGEALAPQVNLQPAPSLIEIIIENILRPRLNSEAHGDQGTKESSGEGSTGPKPISGHQRDESDDGFDTS